MQDGYVIHNAPLQKKVKQVQLLSKLFDFEYGFFLLCINFWCWVAENIKRASKFEQQKNELK